MGLVGIMAGVAVTEELLFRGVLFRIIEGWTGTWIALTVTSLLFGLVHLIKPNSSLWRALAIAIEAGGEFGPEAGGAVDPMSRCPSDPHG